jgi:hypothetical protein
LTAAEDRDQAPFDGAAQRQLAERGLILLATRPCAGFLPDGAGSRFCDTERFANGSLLLGAAINICILRVTCICNMYYAGN